MSTRTIHVCDLCGTEKTASSHPTEWYRCGPVNIILVVSGVTFRHWSVFPDATKHICPECLNIYSDAINEASDRATETLRQRRELVAIRRAMSPDAGDRL